MMSKQGSINFVNFVTRINLHCFCSLEDRIEVIFLALFRENIDMERVLFLIGRNNLSYCSSLDDWIDLFYLTYNKIHLHYCSGHSCIFLCIRIHNNRDYTYEHTGAHNILYSLQW